MSLNKFVQQPHVRKMLQDFCPPTECIPCAMQVPPRGNNVQRVGTALDYLLRFELGRRVRGLEDGPWVAERAENRISADAEPFESWDAFEKCYRRTKRCVPRYLREAKDAVSNYRRKRKPTRQHQIELACHAIRLARLDVLCRTGKLDAHLFDKPAKDEAVELVDLLALAPIDAFVDRGHILLNPTFGDASRLVGGADADLILGDMLIDIKTVKEKSPRAQYFYQLLGYFILARHAHRLKPSFPTINILGLYFSRHGYLRTWDVKPLHKDPEFLILEQWFLDEAAGHHADGTACDMCPTPGEGKNCAHCIAMNLPQVPTLETNPILSRPRLTHQITPFTPDRTLARPRDGIAVPAPAPSNPRGTHHIY